MTVVLTMPDFDLATRSASGFLLRWIAPRLGPFHLFSGLARRKPFQLSAPQSDIIILMGHGEACYSDDTEVLTEDGWKQFTELNGREKVATLNTETNEIEYHWLFGNMN